MNTINKNRLRKLYLTNKIRHGLNPLHGVYSNMRDLGFEKDTSLHFSKIYGNYFYRNLEKYFLKRLDNVELSFRKNVFVQIVAFKKSFRKNYKRFSEKSFY